MTLNMNPLQNQSNGVPGNSGEANPAFLDTEFSGREPQQPRQGRLASIVVEGEIEEEEPVGEQWKNPIEFLLSCIAMSVGLGNVWRFPFVAYENGGGTFIIPYLFVLFFIGKPLYYLEMALGQFSSYGQVKVWKLSPLFKGIGYGSMVGTWCVLSYYCSLMALTIYYFIASFSSPLPWSVCDPKWEGVQCNGTSAIGENKTLPELYYEKTVFPQLDSIDDGIGAPEILLTTCLFVSWTVICLSLVKGVKSSGKVAYFTALFPYVVLLILLIRGLTLEGAWAGVQFLFHFDPAALLSPKIWFAAISQCFFSLSIGFGPIIMFSSYNPFTHNVHRDAWIISIMDTMTSLLASVTIFSILGSLAHESGLPIKDVVKSGPGLAFISYPDAIAKFDQPVIPQLFSVLFFLMLFTLGVGSATALTSGVIRIIHDQFPTFNKLYITIVVCFAGFLSGLIYVTPGGQFMLTLVDHYGAAFIIYVMVILEVVAVSWVYGLSNVCRDIEFMIKRRVSWYWRVCWGLIIPIGLSTVLIYTLSQLKPLTHNGIDFPDIALIAGWLLFGGMISLIPIAAAHTIYTRKAKTLWEKFEESVRPAHDWGPKSAKLREEWRSVPPTEKTKVQLQRIFNRIRTVCQSWTS